MKQFITSLLLLSVLCPSLFAETKPNIILIYTDDHGHADLGIQGAVNDIKTPNLDALARSGVVARHGYSTAPQCVPSRGGLMTGKFQGRFKLDNNGSALDGFDKETTIAWRVDGDKDFVPANRTTFPITASDNWQTHEINLPATGTIIHLRVHLPEGTCSIRGLELKP